MSYELDLNLYSISREVYNALDMLGDIGALQYALFLIFSFLLTILNFQKMDNYLVSEMFQVVDSTALREGRTKIKHINGQKVTLTNNGLHRNRLNYCRELLYGKCLRQDIDYNFSLKCLRRTRMERLFEEGR